MFGFVIDLFFIYMSDNQEFISEETIRVACAELEQEICGPHPSNRSEVPNVLNPLQQSGSTASFTIIQKLDSKDVRAWSKSTNIAEHMASLPCSGDYLINKDISDGNIETVNFTALQPPTSDFKPGYCSPISTIGSSSSCVVEPLPRLLPSMSSSLISISSSTACTDFTQETLSSPHTGAATTNSQQVFPPPCHSIHSFPFSPSLDAPSDHAPSAARLSRDPLRIPSDYDGPVFRLWVCNIGDSRTVLVTADGSVEELSEDHKPTNPAETKRIQQAGKYVKFGRVGGLAVSRAFGDLSHKMDFSLPRDKQAVIAVPDIKVAYLLPGDTTVVACDGIFDVLTSKEVGEFAYIACEGLPIGGVPQWEVTNPNSGELHSLQFALPVASQIVRTAIERSSTDNLTCLVIKFCSTSLQDVVPDDPCVSTIPTPLANFPSTPLTKLSVLAQSAPASNTARPSSVPQLIFPFANKSANKINDANCVNLSATSLESSTTLSSTTVTTSSPVDLRLLTSCLSRNERLVEWYVPPVLIPPLMPAFEEECRSLKFDPEVVRKACAYLPYSSASPSILMAHQLTKGIGFIIPRKRAQDEASLSLILQSLSPRIPASPVNGASPLASPLSGYLVPRILSSSRSCRSLLSTPRAPPLMSESVSAPVKLANKKASKPYDAFSDDIRDGIELVVLPRSLKQLPLIHSHASTSVTTTSKSVRDENVKQLIIEQLMRHKAHSQRIQQVEIIANQRLQQQQQNNSSSTTSTTVNKEFSEGLFGGLSSSNKGVDSFLSALNKSVTFTSSSIFSSSSSDSFEKKKSDPKPN